MSDETQGGESTEEIELREAGIAIVREEPDFKLGKMTHYRIVGKKRDTDKEFDVIGDDRASAVRALHVAALAQ